MTQAADTAGQTRDGHAGSLADQAYHAISEMMFARALSGGDVIIEARLAEALGLSRTPLRAALNRLEGEGLVTKGDGRNYVVRSVDIREYVQSLRLRLLVEPDATFHAAQAIPTARLAEIRAEIVALRDHAAYHTAAHWFSDDRLHNTILEFCGNDVTARVLRNLRAATRLFEVARLQDRLLPDCSEHLAILDALEARAPEAASDAMARHLQSLIDFTYRHLALG